MKSYNKPTNRQLDQAMPLLSSPQHEAYFFSRLENPNWIGPLAERNFFKYPPKTEHLEGERVRFPPWPAGRYLARMAAKAPDEVAAILAEIQTDNPSVIGVMLDAAHAMPYDVALSIVPAICRAAKENRLWIHFTKANEFCLRLAEGNHPQAALALAEALFAPTFEKGEEFRRPENQYWYKENLRRIVPVLVERSVRESVRVLCNWLSKSVAAKRKADENADYSYLWRPFIEEHEQNPDYDLAGVMVGFVKDALEQAIRSGRLSLQDALAVLEGHSHCIFKRIKLYLIGEFSDQDGELARQMMLSRDLFDDYEYRHEYATLVRRRFELLSPQQQDEWFGWVDAGPDMSNFEQSMKSLGRDETTEEDRQASIHDWQFEKLHWVEGRLKGQRREFYEKLLAQRGEPESADSAVRVSFSLVGDESPLTVERLATMTFEQAVDAVSSWRPESSRFTGPSIAGLGSAFEQYIATKSEEFSTEARILIGRPAIFVRGFLNQMIEAIKAGRQVDVSAVLDLCDWVLTRPVEERTTRQQLHDRPVDQNWQWTRDHISRLVESICTTEEGHVAGFAMDSLRERMWRLIASLCRDIAESYIIHDVSKEDPRLHDYLDIAINSPRGMVVQAALKYARWVANHIKVSQGRQEVIPGGFGAMPEVLEMLEWQIAPENRSFEALAIIGSRIGLIYWIDNQWLAQNANRLFRLEAIEQGPGAAHGWAAWNAFLVWVRPHTEFYRLFKSQFAYAVRQAANVNLTERGLRQPMFHLGEHLMLVYGRGQLGLDDDECILRRFVEEANPDVRRHAIGFVGQSLQGEEKVPDSILLRFQALWNFYWKGPGRKDAAESPNAWLFGMWFSCGKFPDSWALEQLEQFVEVNQTPEPDHEIVESLAKIAHVDIARSVRILDKMVRGDREGWRINHWRDSAKEILAAALRNPGEPQNVAKGLINYLGRRGYEEFGQLLA